MSEMKPMTLDYAHLSMIAGIFAGAADAALGRTYFATKVRADRWNLTPEKLHGWRQEAIAMGVPVETLRLSPETEACLPTMVKIAQAEQKKIDASLNEKTSDI